MSVERVQLFLNALRDSELVTPNPDAFAGGYVGDLEGAEAGATIDGWWTMEQIAYALDVAEGRTAPADLEDED